MGWTFQNTPLRHETPAAYFTRHYTHDSGTYQNTVLATSTVRETVYAAIHNRNTETSRCYVYCAVFLFKNSKRDGFGYKVMCESSGPYEVECPDRIMRLLSPVEVIPDPGSAAEWRSWVAEAKAWKAETRALAKRFAIGDRIKLANAVYFSASKLSEDEFRLLRFQNRTPIFEAMNHVGLICRLRKASLADATLITH